MPTIRRLAYSAVSTARPLPPSGEAEDASTTLNDGRTNGVLEAGWAAVQSRMPTPNAPICSSWARSGLRAPVVSTWKSRPLSGFRLMRMAPASTPLRTSSAVAAASVRGSKSNFRTPGSPPGSGALSALSMTATARAASAASSATTPTCVTVARSRSRTPSGISATTTARPISSSVENTNARDRTRSMYSRRATSPTLVPFELSGMASGGAGGTACGLLVTPRPRPRRLATWRRGASAPSVAASSPSTGARWVSWSAGWPT